MKYKYTLEEINQAAIDYKYNKSSKNMETLYVKSFDYFTIVLTKYVHTLPNLEDIRSEAQMVIFESIDKFDETKSVFTNWAYGILKNTTFLKCRYESRYVNEFIDSDVFEDTVDGVEGKSVVLEKEDIWELYDEFMEYARKRKFNEHYLKGLEIFLGARSCNYKELGENLGWKNNTRKTRMWVGRKLFADYIVNKFDEYDNIFVAGKLVHSKKVIYNEYKL